MTLGSQIKTQRLNKKLSQEKVAELVGVSRQAVTKWESDLSAPSTENLLKLSQIFDCSLAQLTGTQPASEPTPTDLNQAPNSDPQPERKHPFIQNIKTACLFAGIYLGWFLLCKCLWARLGDQTLLQWLFGTSPFYHDYLFGWILDFWLGCSLVSILPALWGKIRFSAVTTAGFILALPLGEHMGSAAFLSTPGYHYGWAIWGGIWIASILFGIVLQRFSPADLNRNSKKLRIWCIAAVFTVIGIIAFVLLNVPRHSFT